MKFYRVSLAVVERLAKVDPGEALWQRESSTTYSKVGDILAEQRNLPDALRSYQASLAIAERLAKVDPGGARWRRELAATYNKVGDMLAEQRNLPDALKSYRAGLLIAERLAMGDPGNARRQTELLETTTRSSTSSRHKEICPKRCNPIPRASRSRNGWRRPIRAMPVGSAIWR